MTVFALKKVRRYVDLVPFYPVDLLTRTVYIARLTLLRGALFDTRTHCLPPACARKSAQADCRSLNQEPNSNEERPQNGLTDELP